MGKLILLLALVLPLTASAGTLSGLIDFTTGVESSAPDMNTNFASVETEVTDNAGDIVTNATAITTNIADIATNAADILLQDTCAEITGCIESAITAATTDTLTNKTLDGGGTGNDLSLRTSADCDGETDGVSGEPCYDTTTNTVWVCEPTAGGCDTAGEWIDVAAAGAGEATTYEVLDSNLDIGFSAAQVPAGNLVCQSDGTNCAAGSGEPTTYEQLSTNSDIGFSASQVPDGSLVCQSDGTNCTQIGDVIGPGPIGIDNAIATFNGTGGLTIQQDDATTPVTAAAGVLTATTLTADANLAPTLTFTTSDNATNGLIVYDDDGDSDGSLTFSIDIATTETEVFKVDSTAASAAVYTLGEMADCFADNRKLEITSGVLSCDDNIAGAAGAFLDNTPITQNTITSDVEIGDTTSAPAGKLAVHGDANEVTFAIKGDALQVDSTDSDLMQAYDSADALMLKLDPDGAFEVQSIEDIDGPGTLWEITALGDATFNTVTTADQNTGAQNDVGLLENVGFVGVGVADQYTITDTNTTGDAYAFAHFVDETKVLEFSATTATVGPGTGKTCIVVRDETDTADLACHFEIGTTTMVCEAGSVCTPP